MVFGTFYAQYIIGNKRSIKPKEYIMTHPEIKTILYATDLSPNSAFALDFALDTANLYQAELIILNVFDRPTVGYAPLLDGYMDEKSRQSLFNDHKENVKSSIRKRLEMISGHQIEKNSNYFKILNSIEVCEGYPAETILTMADELNCDMIIMGTHGKGILGHTFLGSTAKRVLRRTRKPIFIIPLPKGKLGIALKDN
jgi:nucleotide-binding universal stress UspA family protein